MPRIFICYRRSISYTFIDAIEHELVEIFGNKNVFKDDSQEAHKFTPGATWEKETIARIKWADYVFVVIPLDWEFVVDDKTQQARLWHEKDPVRRELCLAKNYDKNIIPMLINRRAFPTTDSIPEELWFLEKHTAVILQDDEINKLKKRLAPIRMNILKRKLAKFAILIMALVMVSSIILLILLPGSATPNDRNDLESAPLPSATSSPPEVDYSGTLTAIPLTVAADLASELTETAVSITSTYNANTTSTAQSDLGTLLAQSSIDAANRFYMQSTDTAQAQQTLNSENTAIALTTIYTQNQQQIYQTETAYAIDSWAMNSNLATQRALEIGLTMTALYDPTETPTATRTSSPTPTETFTPTSNNVQRTMWVNYIRTEPYRANIRAHPLTSADRLDSVAQGEEVSVIQEIEGESVSNSTVWYQVRTNREIVGFIHSSLLSEYPVPTLAASNTSAVSPCTSGSMNGTAAGLFQYEGKRSQSIVLTAGRSIQVTLSVSNAIVPYGVGIALVNAQNTDVASTDVVTGESTSSFTYIASSTGVYRLEVRGESRHTYNYSVSWIC